MNVTLLDQIIEAHGGMALWRSLDAVVARMRFGGLAFASRFKWAGTRERQVEVFTREPRAIFHDYPRPNQRGIFTTERVWIESGTGKIIAERAEPRSVFPSLRRYLWWDYLDLLYFAGYGVWNYLTTPFLLAAEGVEAEETGLWKEAGEVWRRLAVRFPETIPTHSHSQVFYFDEQFRLRRFDYDPVIFAPRAKAAHYCFEHRSFSGLLLPTKRRVLPRAPGGRSRPWAVLVWIDIKEVHLVRMKAEAEAKAKEG